MEALSQERETPVSPTTARDRFTKMRGPGVNDATLRGVLLTAFLLAVIVFFAAQDSSFLTQGNALNIIGNASVIGIVSLGQVLTIISGGFDLSVSGTVPLGAGPFPILVKKGWGVSTALLLSWLQELYAV